MKNKILIELIVPELDRTFDIYIPANKKVGNILELLNKSLKEISNGDYINNNSKSIYNRDTNELYQMDVIIRNTNIRNGTSLVIV